MAAGRPLLDQLTVAAPDVNRLSSDVPELAAAARPTLRRLAPVLRNGAATSRRSKPMLRLLGQYSARSLPSARTAGEMFPTLERRGFVTDLLSFFYNMAVATARYDENGHILPAHVSVSLCSRYAEEPDPDCKTTGAAAAKPSSKGKPDRRAQERGQTPFLHEPPAHAGGPSPQQERPPRSPSSPAPALPQVPDAPPVEPPPPIDPLLDFLLR
jgi:hypothetical protein